MEKKFQVKRLDELTSLEWFEIVKLRIAVFVVEQHCPYQEVDDIDLEAFHFSLLTETGDLAGYTRIYDDGVYLRIGRVIVASDFRKQGLGEALMQQTIAWLKAWDGTRTIKIEAQAHLQHFYGKLGFEPSSEEYLEDGIPHVDMLLQ